MSYSDDGSRVDCDSCSNTDLSEWYTEGSKHICTSCRPDEVEEDILEDIVECRGCGAPDFIVCPECDALGLA